MNTLFIYFWIHIFSLPQAKSMLEKALAIDSTHLDAVYLLADILQEERNYAKAIDL